MKRKVVSPKFTKTKKDEVQENVNSNHKDQQNLHQNLEPDESLEEQTNEDRTSEDVDNEEISLTADSVDEEENHNDSDENVLDAEVDFESMAKVIAERDEYLKDLQRLQAEFNNYRRRMVKEREDMRHYLLQEFMAKLIDVADNMERALNTDSDTTDVDSYRKGVQMVFQQFMAILNDQGLTRINTVGEKFDPEFHEAVARVETIEHEENTIVSEFMPGYKIKDRVLRAPKVQVAAQPEKIVDNNDEESAEPENNS